MRKILVVLIAFLSVLAIYLLYLRLVPMQQESADADDINIVDISGQTGNAGKIGDVAVESVEKARYVTINPQTKEVEREYGFAKLLHESGSEWEIEKPYMLIFSGDSTIKFTADKGTVQLETISNTPTPKDATLTGNVVIEIGRNDSSQTTYVYLEDISYIGDQSLFSTPGPVKVKNPRIELDGRGVEMIYNEQAKRLEYLRIVELEKLNFKDILFDPASSTKDTAAENPVQPIPAGTKPVNSKPQYQLVFDRSVLINAPQQRIFTDRLSIENIIFASSSSKSKSARTETDSAISEQTSNTIDDGFDITLSCDNGIFVRPMDSELFSLPQVQQIGDIESGGKQTLFVADKITGDMVSEKLTAYRPRVDFLADNFIDPNSQSNLPVNVTCERMDFISASDRLVFEGDVRCKMTEQLPQGFRNEYTLDTPRLILNLGSKKQAESGPFTVDHVTGDNGIVQLAAAKWKDDEFFGFMKLKCYQFDYNSLGQMFIAKGPGLFALDNSKTGDEENKRNKKKISLTKQCYALIENFDVLKYDLINNKIEAGAPTDDFITMNYVPVTDKGNGEATNISAGHINARFISVDNRAELSDVYASEGVSFEDQKNIFSGSELLYNGDESMLYVNGTESMPAMLNNAQVVGIEHNIRTGRTKVKAVGISVFNPQ